MKSGGEQIMKTPIKYIGGVANESDSITAFKH